MIKNINMAYYRKEDWKRFIASIDDKENMHETWEEWHLTYLETKRKLSMEGFIMHDFIVDIDELQNYCRKRGIKNDGKARSLFVSNR